MKKKIYKRIIVILILLSAILYLGDNYIKKLKEKQKYGISRN